jgi:hypothetical protein
MHETLRAWYLQAEQETDTNNAKRARMEALEVISAIFEGEKMNV